jgi:hypothetical protein
MSALGEKHPQLPQTTLAVSTALALLGHLDVITISVFRGLEQRFFKMRISDASILNSQFRILDDSAHPVSLKEMGKQTVN